MYLHKHSLSLSQALQLRRQHWSIASTLPGIDCTFPNYICSGCHCGAIVKYLSKERSEATGRSHVLSGPSGTDSKVLFCYRKRCSSTSKGTGILNMLPICVFSRNNPLLIYVVLSKTSCTTHISPCILTSVTV